MDGRRNRPLRARRRERALRVVGSRRSSPRGENAARCAFAACKHETVLVTLRAAPRSAHRRSRAMTNCAVRTQFPLSCVPPQQTSAYAGPSRRRERGGSCAASCAPGDSRSNRKGPFSSFEHWQWRRRRCPALEGSTRFPTRTRILDPGWLLTTIGVVTGLQSTAGGAHHPPGTRPPCWFADSARSVLGPTVLSSARLPPGLPTPPRARTSRLPGNSSPRVWFSS